MKLFCLVRNDAAGYITYIGASGTIIEYNPEYKEWIMRSIMYPSVSATSKAPFHTLAIGLYTWTVYNDIECQEGMVQKTLSLTSCFFHDEDEFTCHDGLCINLKKRCDGIPDCTVICLLFTSIIDS